MTIYLVSDNNTGDFDFVASEMNLSIENVEQDLSYPDYNRITVKGLTTEQKKERFELKLLEKSIFATEI